MRSAIAPDAGVALLAERDRLAAEAAAMREVLNEVQHDEYQCGWRGSGDDAIPVMMPTGNAIDAKAALASDAGVALLAERDALRAEVAFFAEKDAQRQQLIRDVCDEQLERALDREAMVAAREALGRVMCCEKPVVRERPCVACDALALLDARLAQGGGE